MGQGHRRSQPFALNGFLYTWIISECFSLLEVSELRRGQAEAN